MRLLRIAIEKKRWDLAAHTIVLATASVLENGDKPRTSKRVVKSPPPGISGVARVTKPRRG